MPNGLINIDIVAKFAQFERDLQKVDKRLAGMQTTATNFAKGFASAFAGAFGAAAIGAAVKGTIDLADNLNDLSKRTQVSVKDLAALKLVAEQNGTSLEDVGKAIQKLNLSVSQGQAGTKEQAEALKRLGINSSDARERLFQLADAYVKSGGSGRVLADIQKVLGKSYAEMIPLLAQGGAELRRSAEASETFAQAIARLAPNADKFNDQMAELKQTSAGLAAQLLNAVIPSLSEYGKALADIVEKGSLLDKIKFFSLGFIGEDTLNRISDAGKRVQDYNQQIAKQQQLILELQRVEKQGSPTLAYQEKRLADLERTRAGLIAQARKDAASVKPSAAAPSNVLDFPSASKTKSTKPDKLSDIVSPLYLQQQKTLKEQTEAFAETERMLAEHLQDTNAELFAQSQAWTEAGRALEEEMRTPLEDANIELARLQELLDRGAISFETFSRATFKLQEGLEGSTEKLSELDNFAKTAAENIQNSFADFLFDPFQDGLDGMLKGFGQTIQRMIADAVAADLAKWLFGDLIKGGSGSGVAGGILSAIGGLFSFDGGGYTGSGQRSGGLDGRGGFLSVLHPNETVVDHNRGQRIGGGPTIIVNVSGTTAPDVRRAAGQGAREALALMNGARRYG